MQSDKTIKFLDKLKESGNYNENHDYSLVNYINISTKIVIIDEYGFEHEIIAGSLLDGNKLTIRSVIDKNEYLIRKFKEIHGDKYDYKLLNFKDSKTKIDIICDKHGKFEQIRKTGGLHWCLPWTKI